MSGKDIDTLARADKPLPEDAGLCDMMLYRILSAIYAEYREGILSASDAKDAKHQAMTKHGDLELWERVFRDHARRMVEIGAVLNEVNHDGCPKCQKIAKIFDGRLNS